MVLSAFRVYTSTPRSVEHLPKATLMTGVHIVLAFARDYDSDGKHQIGKFETYFDSTFNAQTIQAIKDSANDTTVMFFLSIGGRDERYAFKIPTGMRDVWVENATDSLKKIIDDHGFDGIDIYYEHVEHNSKKEFAGAIRELIWNLKSNDYGNIISIASLTVSAPLNKLYHELYRSGQNDFDHVVYQSHSVTSPISTFNDLVKEFDKLIHQYHYPKNKIFAGHSDVLPSDWKNVPLPIFLGAVPKLLANGFNSISKWTVTDPNPEA